MTAETWALRGKVIVVTGSTKGLGLAIAHTCAAEGAKLVVSSRSEGAVAATVGSLRASGAQASGIPCDVGDLARVEALAAHAVESFGGFDVWINNAGYAAYWGPTAHVAPSVFVRTVQTNILGTYYGSIVALRHFLAQGTGKLINMLGRGDRNPAPKQNGYGSSKAWIRNFTLALAREYRNTGVGIYAYNPGMMTTDMLTDVVAVSGYESDLKSLPGILDALARPPEVAGRKVVWLASARTDGRTGLEIHELGRLGVLSGFLRVGLRRLVGRQAPSQQVKISLVPAALPLPSRSSQRSISGSIEERQKGD